MAKIKYLFLLLWIIPFITFAATPLPEDQAFRFSAQIDNKTQVTANFVVASGYYLYAKKMHFVFTPAIGDYQIPQGDFKYDQDRGRYEALSGNVIVPIHLQNQTDQLRMQVFYQGCSQDGFCYPPTEKNLQLNFKEGTITTIENPIFTAKNTVFSAKNLLTDQYQIQTFLQSKQIGFVLLMFFGLGLLLAFTPCVLPMIPILTSIIVGQRQVTMHKAFLLASTYVIGSALTYAIAGVIAAAMGHSLQVWLQQPMVIAGMSALFALLAFSLFGVYELRMPNKWQHQLTMLSNKQQGGTYIGVFLMGMLSTLIVSPCVTAPLVGVLVYIGKSGNVFLGASALFLMGLGMGFPLILIGISAGKYLPKSGAWMNGIKKLFGFFMLAMAIWLLSRIASTLLIHVAWSLLIIAFGLFIAAYLPRFIALAMVPRMVGAVVIGTGVIVMANGFYQQQAMQSSFKIVRSVDDLNAALASAKEVHRPVILDFYADWCESCVVMDKQVFDRESVRQALKNYVLLRADLSNNDMSDQLLLKQYDVIAPPTVIFFNRDGEELNVNRIVGEVDAKEFLNRLQIVRKNVCEKNIEC